MARQRVMLAPQATAPVALTSTSTRPCARPRMRWTPQLHNIFLTAVEEVRAAALQIVLLCPATSKPTSASVMACCQGI